MKKIFFPGWGFAPEDYSAFTEGMELVLDYGFFSDSVTYDIKKKDLPEVTDDSVLIGHSLGGLFAVEHSVTSKVKAVVLVSGFPLFVQKDDFNYGQKTANVRVMQENISSDPFRQLKSFARSVFSPEKGNFQVKNECNSSLLRDGLDALISTDLRETISYIKVPVYIIHGKKDRIVSYNIAEWMNENILNSHLVPFENAGHALPFTRSEEINHIIDKIGL